MRCISLRRSQADPDGYPWRPAPLSELLSRPLVSPTGQLFRLAPPPGGATAHVVVFFGGAWCPPCKAFSPKLAEAVAEARAAGVLLHAVYVCAFVFVRLTACTVELCQ